MTFYWNEEFTKRPFVKYVPYYYIWYFFLWFSNTMHLPFFVTWFRCIHYLILRSRKLTPVFAHFSPFMHKGGHCVRSISLSGKKSNKVLDVYDNCYLSVARARCFCLFFSYSWFFAWFYCLSCCYLSHLIKEPYYPQVPPACQLSVQSLFCPRLFA